MTAPLPRKHIPRWVWLLAAGLLLWLGCITYLKYPRSYPSTGDAFLNAYLSSAGSDGAVDNRTLAKWEPFFHNDPRYWELKAWQHNVDSSAGELEITYLWDSLDHARKNRWPVSAPLLNKYISLQEDQWAQEVPNVPKLPEHRTTRPPNDVIEEERIAIDQFGCRGIDKAHRKERDELYKLLQETAPGASQTWYSAARLEFQRDNYTGALENIRRGNAVGYVTFLPQFPAPEYVQALRAPNALSANPRFSLLAAAATSAEYSNFSRWKEMHRGLWRRADERNDRAALNALHQLACRMCLTDEAGTYQVLVGTVLLRYETKYLSGATILSTAEKQKLAPLQAKLDKLRLDVKALNANAPSSKLQSTPGVMDVIREMGNGSYGAFSIESSHADYVYLQRELVNNILPQVREIAKFDFVTMEFGK